VVLFIIELKHVYKIDIIPGYNGVLDDIYFKIKEVL
jgi:hypothetical protein